MTSSTKHAELKPRAQWVLEHLVELYIKDGNPVASKSLAVDGIKLSPATIRSVMSNLEDMGFIESPHKSAGRVPTAKGYRLFIDSVVQARQQQAESLDESASLDTRIVEHIGDGDQQSVLSNASALLSQITSYAGIISVPSAKHNRIKQIEFLALSEKKILAILITDDGQVQNRVFLVERQYSESELVTAANYFNSVYASKTIETVREQLRQGLKNQHMAMRSEMQSVLELAGQLVNDNTEDESAVLVSGETNLLRVPDFTEFERLRELVESFKTKQILAELLQRSIDTHGVNIFIGEESGYDILNDCSIITSPYQIDESRVGVLAVVGPKRMPYESIISTVDITARVVGTVLSQGTSV